MTQADSNGLYNGIPIEESAYNYVPTRYVAIIFLVLFAISTLTHLVQAAKYRTWYLIFTAGLCGCLELAGWSGRLWSSWNPFLSPPFQLQIVCTIFGPTPLLAAVFVIFGEIIGRLGSVYSRFGPKWYTIIFCSCDVLSLLIQGAGGGIAAGASTLSGANDGGRIMLIGIIFQVVVIIAFTLLATEFTVRYLKDAPVSAQNATSDRAGASTTTLKRGHLTPKIKLMMYTLSFVTLVLFIRGIYRTAELADGWNGRIISTEVYFNVLDGAMVVLAITSFNFVHPGVQLAGSRELKLEKSTSV